jgi:hypothetical protein
MVMLRIPGKHLLAAHATGFWRALAARGRAAAVLTAVLAANAPARGQQPAAPNPHEGEWSLDFRVQTRPGGDTRVASINITPPDIQTDNVLMQVSRPSFTVAANGALRWEQRDGGQFHWDCLSRLAGMTATADSQAVLRVQGKAIATPAPEGSPQAYSRRLTLDLSWSGGTGMTVDHMGKPWPVSLSADGNQVITPFGTRPAEYERSSWDLKQTSFQKDEISPDVIRETTTFRNTRQKEAGVFKMGLPPAPLIFIERIEIKHIHYPRLVPRG